MGVAMNEKPEVSVVMSVYNNADTLSAAMDSILTQEGVAIEFIVIDDGSTDGSSAILDDYARRDNRVRVEHQENTGLTRALIRGCSLARAPWIARQDADDVSLPGRLKKQLECVSDKRVCLIGCHARARTPDGVILSEVRAPERPDEARTLVIDQGRSISPHGSIMFRRTMYEAVGGYRTAFCYAQDVDLNIRMAEQGGVAVAPEFLYEYRYSPGDISGSCQPRQQALYRLIIESQRLRSEGRSDGVVVKEAEELSTAFRQTPSKSKGAFYAHYFMGSCLLRHHPRKALGYLKKAVAARPWSMKAWFRLSEAWVRSAGDLS